MKRRLCDIFFKAVGVVAIASAMLLTGCGEEKMSNDVVVQNSDFTITGDSVKQGDWIASATSDMRIVSNYAPENESQMSNDGVVMFRLSFNGHDNELPYGEFQYALMGQDTTTIAACKPDEKPTEKGDTAITTWHLKVDMRAQKKSMDEKGYFVTATGDTIYREEFKGIWLAGNIAPLSLHFLHLEDHEDLQLKESGEPGIYEAHITFKPKGEPLIHKKEWKINALNADYPTFSSPMHLINALYNMSIDDISKGKISGENGEKAFKRRVNNTRMN